MKSFETTIKPLLKFGDGVAKETGKKFKEFGCKKVLAGYDANLPEAIVSTVLDSITAEGIELIPYSCPYADGQDTGVLEVRQLAIDNQVDGFLAMGGGSTMDIVKAASLLVDKPLPIDQYFVGWYNGPDLPRKAHLISIPTTSGTGAEERPPAPASSPPRLSASRLRCPPRLQRPTSCSSILRSQRACRPMSPLPPAWTLSPTPAKRSAA